MNIFETQAIERWRLAMAEAGFSAGKNRAFFHFSQLATPGGDRQAAEIAYHQLLDVLPQYKDALEGLTFLLQLQGRGADALEFRQRLLTLHVQDLGVVPESESVATDYLLAGEGWITQPDKAPAAYVRSLFDQYADNFETHLLEKLRYRVPGYISDLASEFLGGRAGTLDVLDLGCGTGLVGEKLHAMAKYLHGVDLSGKMLARARARHIYDRLDQGDLVEITGRHDAAFDLVVAADVLVYFGVLPPLISAVRGSLRDAGFFVFSVEKGLREGFRLRAAGRYQHHAAYIGECAHEAGFEVAQRREVSLRNQDGKPVSGYVFALQAC